MPPRPGLIKKLPEATLRRMRSVGLKVLKNKLSEYVRLAAAGETVLVTDRDKVVAELVPPREGRSPLLADAVLAEAVRKGFMTPSLHLARRSLRFGRSSTISTKIGRTFELPRHFSSTSASAWRGLDRDSYHSGLQCERWTPFTSRR